MTAVVVSEDAVTTTVYDGTGDPAGEEPAGEEPAGEEPVELPDPEPYAGELPVARDEEGA